MLKLADSILSNKNKDNEKYAKLNPLYHGLKHALGEYVAIAKKGNWDTIKLTKTKFITGKNFPDVLSLKRRLSATGEFTVKDTNSTFTPELEAAIKDYQSL
ncbi:hypothetical protein GWC95_05315 [Sediminibacterium roseum]|uniref:Uncharacterized protein n=1 Tax=Sediminibacterium roseum TaxID=1978412 RepID=A0ABW9ZQG9_9BACT|nr:hypothetical protein [Sediminibacterium roseum]NCI49330.1 hypothetical protein [Sediminibacterium roseum]TAJ60631.1 MAG: hypothetical protein EPO58_05065 [Chitinophagaceae bacterium]